MDPGVRVGAQRIPVLLVDLSERLGTDSAHAPDSGKERGHFRRRSAARERFNLSIIGATREPKCADVGLEKRSNQRKGRCVNWWIVREQYYDRVGMLHSNGKTRAGE